MTEELSFRDQVRKVVDENAKHIGLRLDVIDDLYVAFDSDVTWSPPEQPRINSKSLHRFNDQNFWKRVSDSYPTWINVAVYRFEESWALILDWSERRAPAGSQPAISLSAGGSQVKLSRTTS